MALTTIHGDWANWVEDIGWSGSNANSVISASQFTSETGVAIPSDHSGTVLKFSLTEAGTNARMKLTSPSSEDVSSWVSLCMRWYVSGTQYDNIDEAGHVRFGLEDGAGTPLTAELRGGQGNLGGLTHEGMNFSIWDPNADNQTWMPGDTDNNYGWRLNSVTATDIEEYQVSVAPDATMTTSPLIVYILDVVRDVGLSPINVCVGWDDSKDDMWEHSGDTWPDSNTVDKLARKYNIKQTSFYQSGGIGNGTSVSAAEVELMRRSGRWEFVNHSDSHANYETLTSDQVATEIATCNADMQSKNLHQSRSYRCTSRPQNAAGRNLSGKLVTELETSLGIAAGRRGHYGIFSETLGVDNPMTIGSFPFGQTLKTQIDDHAEWATFHTQMKTMGMSYVLYGHGIVASSPGTNEVDYDELELVFAALQDDVQAGTVVLRFFGEWCETMGVDLGYNAQRINSGTRPTAGTRPVAGTRPLAGTRVAA